ncbi:hypothetical protein C7402_102100 [Paraburkholderia unamae]|uniref:Uncharacterized protein n=1 Tax=Paraburkholderia unamae TaxID=219649 RepID=A0ABX5KYV0_9BURK|nr:hypothetical protein C7402_102100 [Paraburkholderia unamae]
MQVGNVRRDSPNDYRKAQLLITAAATSDFRQRISVARTRRAVFPLVTYVDGTIACTGRRLRPGATRTTTGKSSTTAYESERFDESFASGPPDFHRLRGGDVQTGLVLCRKAKARVVCSFAMVGVEDGVDEVMRRPSQSRGACVWRVRVRRIRVGRHAVPRSVIEETWYSDISIIAGATAPPPSSSAQTPPATQQTPSASQAPRVAHNAASPHTTRSPRSRYNRARRDRCQRRWRWQPPRSTHWRKHKADSPLRRRSQKKQDNIGACERTPESQQKDSRGAATVPWPSSATRPTAVRR